MAYSRLQQYILHIHTNKIVSRIVIPTRNSSRTNKKTRDIRTELRTNMHQSTPDSNLSRTFTILETTEALKEIKVGKAAGLTGVYPEFLRHLGSQAQLWLTQVYNDIERPGTLLTIFRQSKIVDILKSGKHGTLPEDYRTIILLSICYKLLERFVLNRIKPIAENCVPIERAGFRSNHTHKVRFPKEGKDRGCIH